MNLTSSSCIHLVILSFALFSLLPLPSHCSDPAALQDFCIADLSSPVRLNGYACKPSSQVSINDFFFDGLKNRATSYNAFGSNVNEGDVTAWPALNTLGVSMNRIDLGPRGLNPIHTHPRANELGIVYEGQILVGFISTDNVLWSKVLSPGEAFIIPRGLLHFELNVGEGNATFFPAFDSQNPGIQFTSTTLFASNPVIPDEVLRRDFQVNQDVVDLLKARLGAAAPSLEG